MNKWDERWMKMAQDVSKWSKDPSTKVGAIISRDKELLSIGYNGFPKGIEDKEEWLNDRAEKYPRMVHGEANAIVSSRTHLMGATLYCTLVPCSPCSGLIIQCGIIRVVAPMPSPSELERWGESFELTTDNFKRAGVILETI